MKTPLNEVELEVGIFDEETNVFSWQDAEGEWHAMRGKFRFDLDVPVGLGMTKEAAIADLKGAEEK